MGPWTRPHCSFRGGPCPDVEFYTAVIYLDMSRADLLFHSIGNKLKPICTL